MKSSPELLKDILGVLGSINQQLGTITGKSEKEKSSGVGSFVLGSIFQGKKTAKSIDIMADSVKKLNDELKIRVWLAEDPMTCVARGAGLVLENIDKYRQFLVDLERGNFRS